MTDGSDLECLCGARGTWKIEWTWTYNSQRYTDFIEGFELDLPRFDRLQSPICQQLLGVPTGAFLVSGCNGRLLYDLPWTCYDVSNPVFSFTRSPSAIDYFRIACPASPGGVCCIAKTTILDLCKELSERL
jgi:hypothetical protein